MHVHELSSSLSVIAYEILKLEWVSSEVSILHDHLANTRTFRGQCNTTQKAVIVP